MEDDFKKIKKEDDLKKIEWKSNQSIKINLIGCDIIVNSHNNNANELSD